MRRRYKDTKKDLTPSVRTGRTITQVQWVPKQFTYYPQAWLEASHHPYAPFTGDTLRWNSWVFHDASMYEGITRAKVPHGKGNFTVGANRSGGGFEDPEPGDEYVGEFTGGFAHGLGEYRSAGGRKVYKGRWYMGLRDGCGMEYDLSPLFTRLEAGEEPSAALDASMEEIMETAQVGEWQENKLADTLEDIEERLDPETEVEPVCSAEEIGKTLEEVESVAQRARMFAFKPDGDATFYKHTLDDAPMPSNQHPLHYPHGTLFMAPGPAGQTSPLPQDENLHELMLSEFQNYVSIHEMYNFEYDPEPDSLMAQALEWFQGKKERGEMYIPGLQRNEEGGYDVGQIKNDEPGSGQAGNDGGSSVPPPPPRAASGTARAPAQAEQREFDDSDLVADASALIKARDGKWAAKAPTGRPPLGTAFGSLLLSRQRLRLPPAMAARAPVVAGALQRVRQVGPRSIVWPQQMHANLLERAPQWLRGAAEKLKGLQLQ